MIEEMPQAPNPSQGTLVFISHDSRDADLAEAFSRLIKSVSAGMIKTFRSSDKTGTDGVDFGEQWYERLMKMLQATSDVVCLFTARSLDRPWILFEAGVAKGKLDTNVIGVALGVSLARIATGPFYQFMNMDDSEEALTKLLYQLARRVPSLDLDTDVVSSQISAFKKCEAELLAKRAGESPVVETAQDGATAKLLEEMKILPARVAERVRTDGNRRRDLRRFHPMMLDRMMPSGDRGDPLGILLAASIVREDAPWLYEMAMEAYRAVKSGDRAAIEHEANRLRRFSEVALHGPFMEELGIGDRESVIFFIERVLQQALMATRTDPEKSASSHDAT